MSNVAAESAHWARRAQYIYDIHHRTQAGRHLLAQVVDRILRRGGARSGATVLEVGCAAGTQTIELLERGYSQAWGVDINFSVLANAKENARERGVDDHHFLVGDAYCLPLSEASCDLAFSVGVMEHLPDLAAALSEQRRVLRPGGWIVMAVPNTYCPWWVTGKRWRAWISGKDHFAMPGVFRTFTPAQGIDSLSAAGLSEVGWEAADLVVPQCPDSWAWLNIFLERAVSALPLIRSAQAMLYFWGKR